MIWQAENMNQMIKMLRVKLLLAACIVCNASAAEPINTEVLHLCEADLVSEKSALLVAAWANSPLPHDIAQVAKAALGGDVVAGWIKHVNPNRSSTIIIRAVDVEDKELGFIVLFKDRRIVFKHDVSAFDFAFSRNDHDGVTGFFFCDKDGPSREWIWNGSDWDAAK